jgi:hypothetical protein
LKDEAIMHTTDSPEVGASAANAGHPRNNERDNQLLPDPAIRGNCRRPIRVEGGATLYEVFVISSYFELVTDCETERFNTLWDGIVGQIRLAERSAQ